MSIVPSRNGIFTDHLLSRNGLLEIISVFSLSPLQTFVMLDRTTVFVRDGVGATPDVGGRVVERPTFGRLLAERVAHGLEHAEAKLAVRLGIGSLAPFVKRRETDALHTRLVCKAPCVTADAAEVLHSAAAHLQPVVPRTAVPARREIGQEVDATHAPHALPVVVARRRPFGDGRRRGPPGRDGGPGPETSQQTEKEGQECPAIDEPKTTASISGCTFYLTNWGFNSITSSGPSWRISTRPSRCVILRAEGSWRQLDAKPMRSPFAFSQNDVRISVVSTVPLAHPRYSTGSSRPQ